SIDYSSKIDSLLDELVGELTILKSIPPGIDDDNLDPEGEIHLVERFIFDNSSPRPPKELNVENSIKSFSPSPIPVEDKLLSNDSPSLPENESFHFDIPSSPRLPAKPPDDDEIEPDMGLLTTKVVGDISEHYVLIPRLLPTQPTLHMDFDFIPSNDLGSDHDVSSPSGDRNKIYDPGICIEVESTIFLTTLSPVIDTLLPFSSKNEDKVLNHGVLAYKEKSLPSSSHRGFKTSKLSLHESPMLISGDNTPNLGVRHPHFYPP
ncbi:hypothetical protein Tco_0785576, partial [Tanacetum coccineum]